MIKLRIVLDTNVLLSGTAYPHSIPGKIVNAWRSGSIEVVLSEYILDELKRVLPRLNHRLNWTDQEIQEYVDSLAIISDMVTPISFEEQELRDFADRPVLETLLASTAAYLVTGDKDLLSLADKYSVVTPAEFWRIHGE